MTGIDSLWAAPKGGVNEGTSRATCRIPRRHAPADMTDDSENFVRAFARGLEVVDAIGRGGGRQTVATVAEAAALPRSVVKRLLSTLDALGYAATDGKHYWLTPKVLKLGMSYLYSLPYWRHAQLALEELRTQTGESTSMAVLDDHDIVYTVRIPAKRVLASSLTIGDRVPAHTVSMGRVLLSALDDPALKKYLETATLHRFTPRTEVSRPKLRRAILQAREDGYAWVDSELDEAICGIGVPVRDATGAVVAAINVSLQAGSVDEAQAKARFLAPLRSAALRIRMSS